MSHIGGEKFSEVMNNFEGKETFCQLVLDHRNYYSHWSEKKDSKVLKGRKLYFLTGAVNLLLEMCLLSLMGFTEAEINDIINKNSFYRSFIKQYKAESQP